MPRVLKALHAARGGSTVTGGGGTGAPGVAWPPAVVVMNVAEARAALAAGPVLLLSIEAAAGSLGPRGWLALVAAAAAGRPVLHALCCGSAPGHALAALRAGQRLIVLDRAVPAFDQVLAAAAQIGAAILPARPPALALRRIDLRKPAGQVILARWLAGMDPAGR
jgi:hypothetical protein